jgi:aminoglycoside phosphotransferase (APT) family kinase protein
VALIKEKDVLAWVEKTAGEKIVDIERQSGRESGGRPGWFVTLESGTRYYARGCRDEDWGFTSSYSLKTEGDILELLYNEGIKVPKIVARNAEPPVLLMEYVEGENDFTKIEDSAERDSVARDFAAIMAKWHAIDASKFEALGLKKPQTAQDYVLQDLEVWEKGCFDNLIEPVPLITFACKWLRANIPPAPERAVLVQGDTGPGQCLFKDGKIAAVVDFELGFLGDPMRELAQIRTRDVWYPTGNLGVWFNEYARKSGVELDIDKLRYYNVIAMLITTLALAPVAEKPSAEDDHAEWLAQDAWSKLASAEALAEAVGVDVEAPAIPDLDNNPGLRACDILIKNLSDELLPNTEDSFLQHRIKMDLRLLEHAKATAGLSRELDIQELDDMEALLGQRPSSLKEGHRLLNDLVSAAGADQNEKLIKYFYRHAVRQVALMGKGMGRAQNAVTAPLPEVEPLAVA